MKNLSFLLVSVCLVTQAGISQVKDYKSISLENVQAVVIETKGRTSIQHSTQNQINIESYLFKEGKIWGIKSPSERKEFKIEYEITNDTLYISSPDYYSPLMIGISTYSEHIETNMEIPENLPVIVKNSEHITIRDSFHELKVLQSDKIIHNNLKKSEISSLTCIAGDKLLINGISRNHDYEMDGSGNQRIKLLSKEIELNTTK